MIFCFGSTLSAKHRDMSNGKQIIEDQNSKEKVNPRWIWIKLNVGIVTSFSTSKICARHLNYKNEVQKDKKTSNVTMSDDDGETHWS